MRKGVLFLLILVSCFAVRANNVQLQGTVKVISVAGGVATLEVDLSWDNSWRDDYNWDAVWLFFKYKAGVDGAWLHAAINTTGATVTGGDYTTMFATTGTTVQGLFVYPSKDRGGNTGSLKVQVQWATNFTKTQFDNNDVFVVAHGIEMVYIPYGAYALGDGASNKTFRVKQTIDPADDIIGTDPNFTYSCVPMPYFLNASPAGAADRQNNAVWVEPYNHTAHISISNHPAAIASRNTSWIVDFKTPKTIRTFGVSGAAHSDNIHGDYTPSKDWYLQGSNDTLTWTTLSHCVPSDFRRESISYPVRNPIQVQNPGAYRYYRVFFEEMNNGKNGYILANVAMSEKDILAQRDFKSVDGEGSIVLGNNNPGELYADDGKTWTGSISAAFPKGYQGFYVMKYETSQEEYVEFLNTLTLAEQTALIPGVDALNVGDFVFGVNKSVPNYRNGVILSGKIAGKPLLFDNNLNNNAVYSEDGDGGTLAMNYMSISDACGYASWAGLRPMTEMEYEKACRRPYPQEPDAGEYAWNSATGAVNVTAVTNSGRGTETASNGNVNANSGFSGPVRCGAFARSGATNQAASGATYWGVMEMSGNVAELCANITNTNISKTGNGTGVYDAGLYGNFPPFFGTRGGGFLNTHLSLTTSSRAAVSCFTDMLHRDSTVGFRCAFTYDGGGSIDAGTIAEDKQPCPGVTVTFSGTPASAGAVKITGYIWSVNIANAGFVVILGEGGETLTYSNFLPNTTYQFKRKAICPLGEAEVISKPYTIPNIAAFSATPLTATLGHCSATSVTASGVTTYSWQYNGSELATTAGYTPAKAHFSGLTTGDVTVYCTGTLGGCSVTKDITVTLNMGVIVQTFKNCGDLLTDDCGNTYTTKLMNDNRCWMIQNMRRTDIDYLYANNSASDAVAYGCLYDWNTAMQGFTAELAQGICPVGWHIPCDGEWKTLEMAYGMTQVQADGVGYRGTNQGTQFKPGGSSGFNMTLSGLAEADYFGTNGCYWSSSENEANALYRDVYIGMTTVHRGPTPKTGRLSVRCVRD